MSTVAIPFGEGAEITGAVVDPYVNRFVGIPYALPPIGEFRWKKPRKLPVDHFQKLGKYDATQFKDIALQPPSPFTAEAFEKATFSEDCLHLNVWMPSGKPPPEGWPVLIWIHGGWLQLGDPMFDPRMQPWELISKNGFGLDCVILAPAYRLNIFGFLAADAGDKLLGNWGFWDQRLAIEWISEHVKYFGGNPNNVTLGGVSAGSYSTQVQLFYELFQAADAAATKPLFHRVWMSSNAMPTAPKSLTEVTTQFEELCEKLSIPPDTSIDAKLTQLRGISAQTILETMMKLKTPSFRAVLDNQIISKDVFQWIHSGEFARRFKARGMKLLIGEVEHEEAVYSLGAPTAIEGLLPGLLNYYRSSVAKALVDHYTGSHPDVERMFTGIVTDVQVRATTRAFSKALVDGGVPLKDVLRYRVSMPIKAEDENFPAALAEKFKGKVPHAFDFLHWWFTKRVGFTEAEERALREWLSPFAKFIKGEEVPWGTTDITQFRHLTKDASVEIVSDPYWPRLMETASVLRKLIEEEGGVLQTLKEIVVGK